MAGNFRRGPVFLAIDAAHQMRPFTSAGARGYSRRALRQQLTCIRTVSLRTEVSVSRKPIFVRRDKGDETCRKKFTEPSRDEAHGNKSANWAVITGWPGNLIGSRNAWWAREDSNLSPNGYGRTTYQRRAYKRGAAYLCMLTGNRLI
jgi:hypothetical protein